MKNMFNIYYINQEKASEISMLFDNEIVEKITRIKNTELTIDGDANVNTGATTKIPIIGQYFPSLDLKGNLTHNRSNRVEDTVKVVSSKSTILKPLYEKAKEVRRLDDSKVGNLVKIKDVFLSVVEVMFKGSAYVLCGKLPHRFGKDEHMMLKIPMSAENEMESQYSISDIEIGKVTVIGIYRGEFTKSVVESKINRLLALNEAGKEKQDQITTNHDDGIDIEDGVREEDKKNIPNSSGNSKVHYIDVISIIQEINV